MGKMVRFSLLTCWLLYCILFLASCSPQLTLAERELKYGAHSPVIERFYCPAMIRSGDTLKVYISAKDEDADLAHIDVNVRQLGLGEQSAPYINVRKENRASIAGYLYMFTRPAILFGETINVSVAVIDQAGHRSSPVSQDVYFGDKPPPDCPPGWEKECDKALGFIPILLRPIRDQGVIKGFGTM